MFPASSVGLIVHRAGLGGVHSSVGLGGKCTVEAAMVVKVSLGVDDLGNKEDKYLPF